MARINKFGKLSYMQINYIVYGIAAVLVLRTIIYEIWLAIKWFQSKIA